jgi:hypothetical protein
VTEKYGTAFLFPTVDNLWQHSQAKWYINITTTGILQHHSGISFIVTISFHCQPVSIFLSDGKTSVAPSLGPDIRPEVYRTIKRKENSV